MRGGEEGGFVRGRGEEGGRRGEGRGWEFEVEIDGVSVCLFLFLFFLVVWIFMDRGISLFIAHFLV